jgi:hypothetical protein
MAITLTVDYSKLLKRRVALQCTMPDITVVCSFNHRHRPLENAAAIKCCGVARLCGLGPFGPGSLMACCDDDNKFTSCIKLLSDY